MLVRDENEEEEREVDLLLFLLPLQQLPRSLAVSDSDLEDEVGDLLGGLRNCCCCIGSG